MSLEKKIGLGIIGGVLTILFFMSVGKVGAGERGVLLSWGAYNNTIIQPGIYFKLPIRDKVKKINIQAQSLEIEKSEAYTKDLQMVDIKSAIVFNIKPESVGNYYTQYNAEFTGVLVPRLESSIKQTVAQYTSEELLINRGKIQAEIFDLYAKSLPDIVSVNSYSLVNEVFTAEYEKAIEDKQIAQQNSEKATNDLKRIEIEAKQKVASATAEAEAIRIQAEALKENKELVDLRQVEVNGEAVAKWDGKLPTYMLGDSTPFINIK